MPFLRKKEFKRFSPFYLIIFFHFYWLYRFAAISAVVLAVNLKLTRAS